MADMRLSHIRLLVDDFVGCFRFYRDVMGFTPTWGEESEDEAYADFRVSEHTGLALFKRGLMAAAVGTAGLPSESSAQDRVALIFQIDQREEFDRAVDGIRARGGNLVVEPADHPEWGIRTAYARDPAGNLLELETPLAREEMTEELQQEMAKYSA